MADCNRLAIRIATAILKAQAAIALACARNFNACSLRKKKIIFLTITALIGALLLGSIFFKGYTIPALKLTYKPATHIGMASDIVSTTDRNTPLTDSLTTNH